MSKEKQLRVWIEKQKRFVDQAKDQNERDYIIMMWVGFLNGMRMTNAITFAEYGALYDEAKKYAERFDVSRVAG